MLVGYVNEDSYREIDLFEIEWVGVKEVSAKETITLSATGLAGAGILVDSGWELELGI